MTDDEPVADEPPSSDAEKFYQGTIEKLLGGSRMGVVRSGNGRQIPFEFAYVVMLGAVTRFEDLRVGMRVGFDVGWTSSGLRVTILRVNERGASQGP